MQSDIFFHFYLSHSIMPIIQWHKLCMILKYRNALKICFERALLSQVHLSIIIHAGILMFDGNKKLSKYFNLGKTGCHLIHFYTGYLHPARWLYFICPFICWFAYSDALISSGTIFRKIACRNKLAALFSVLLFILSVAMVGFII